MYCKIVLFCCCFYHLNTCTSLDSKQTTKYPRNGHSIASNWLAKGCCVNCGQIDENAAADKIPFRGSLKNEFKDTPPLTSCHYTNKLWNSLPQINGSS